MNAARPIRFLLVAFVLLLGLLTPIGSSAQILPDDDPGSQVHLSQVALTVNLFETVLNGHDADAAARLVTDDAVISTPNREFTGPLGLVAYTAEIRRTYPEAVFDVTSIDRNGDTVVVHWTLNASRYSFEPSEPALDATVTMPGETTITVDDGKVTQLTQAHGDLTVGPKQAEIAVASGHLPSP
jgi:predicted SnoaL-like aldol condensation-catalyzing enzyme